MRLLCMIDEMSCTGYLREQELGIYAIHIEPCERGGKAYASHNGLRMVCDGLTHRPHLQTWRYCKASFM